MRAHLPGRVGVVEAHANADAPVLVVRERQVEAFPVEELLELLRRAADEDRPALPGTALETTAG